MAMRALFTGVSGLRGLQTAIDVIGNNIANVNTTGFKAGRVTFSDMFSQTISGAEGPRDGRGGINPAQVGLGSKVGSIDTIFSQGSIQTTNRLLDLAIQGNGFFQLTDGSNSFFTRAGNFSLDRQGFITAPGTGYRVVGLVADETGVIDPTTTASTVQVVLGASAAAETTENVSFGGNLNSATGTATSPIASARSLSTLVSLFDRFGESLQLRNGDVLQLTTGSFTGNQDGVINTYDTGVSGPLNILTVTPSTTLNDLVSSLQTAMRAATGSATLAVSFTEGGGIQFTTGAGEQIEGVRVGLENNLGRDMTALADVFTGRNTYTRDITVGVNSSVSTQVFRQPDATTSIDVFDSQGNARTITVALAKDVTSLPPVQDTVLSNLLDREGNQIFPPTLATNSIIRIANATTGVELDAITLDGTITSLSDLLDAVTTSLTALAGGAVTYQLNDDGSISFDNGGVNNLADIRFSVVQNPGAGESENLALGEILAERNEGADNGFTIAAGANETTNRFFQTQAITNQWNYRAIAPILPQATVDSNEIGTLVFRSNGQFQGYLRANPVGDLVIEGGAPVLTFDPDGTGPQNNGVDALSINLNMHALTQNAASTTAAMESQDGSPVGELENITIGEDGIITGIFSNGTSRTLAQVLLASFPNEEGLERVGDTLYRQSSNSGESILGAAGTRSRGIIRSTTLELSNVDLATEFTNLIISQRAFQANSRIITTSDNILNEVVNLVR